MTTKYNKVYIENTMTIAGMYENDGPLKDYYDKKYTKDHYYKEKTFEKAEVKLQVDAINGLLKKANLTDKDIDILIGGDLQNQLSASDYAGVKFDIPFLGLYNACATSSEEIIVASTFIESDKAKNAICVVSSHNMVAEKQFRNPSEYGTPKKKTTTFTVTGSGAILLTNKKTKIKVSSSTIGKIFDGGVKDVNNMGGVMAIAAADTIYRHLEDIKKAPDYYDLILTGDLGIYGKKILLEYLKKEYNLDIKNRYDDSGTMLYDLDKQPVYAGGSGMACSALVNYSYVYKEMLKGKYNRVLLVPTGALFSPTMIFQGESIPSIAHAIGLEVVK